ncbi:MAG TPA: Rap1a/Tai family immunity protein [Candidatus Sulfotelmatobacter sp.]|nr:Rap1a/Tai family immunity protein [Candidatus Sulfotelmatobacter sp.]
MRVGILVLAVSAGLAVAAPASARTLDASAKEVAADCRALVTATPPQTFGVGLCLGAFTTLFALSGVVDQNHVPILPFCRPPNVQYLDMVQVFLRHVAAHPETAQNFYAVEAVNALVDAYPCKPK